jgi:hypothetical protein
MKVGRCGRRAVVTPHPTTPRAGQFVLIAARYRGEEPEALRSAH